MFFALLENNLPPPFSPRAYVKASIVYFLYFLFALFVLIEVHKYKDIALEFVGQMCRHVYHVAIFLCMY